MPPRPSHRHSVWSFNKEMSPWFCPGRTLLRHSFLSLLLFMLGSLLFNYRIFDLQYATLTCPEAPYPQTNQSQQQTQPQPISETNRSSTPLPCARFFSDLTNESNFAAGPHRDLFRMMTSTLTYEAREAWLRSINPVIVKDAAYLHTHIRSVCGNRSQRIALLTITNGILASIQEWCFYHLFMGVDKLFIYDDTAPESIERSSFLLALEPFIQGGYVVLHDTHEMEDMDWGMKEGKIHRHFLGTHGGEYDWVGFVGSDEYVVLHTAKCLPDFLSNYTEYGGLVMQWNMRTMVGVPAHDMRKSHFEQYHCSMEDNPHHIKSFVQPNMTHEFYQHHAYYKEGYYAVNGEKQRVDGPFNVPFDPPSAAFAIIELRHFFFGDWKFALYEKTCGIHPMREQYTKHRSEVLIDHGLKRECRTENDALPLIHEEFCKKFFNRSVM